MAVVKQSILSNILKTLGYHWPTEIAKVVVCLYTCILCIVVTLAHFTHWKFVSTLLNLTTGTSLLFILYIFAIILVLDIETYDEIPDQNYGFPDSKPTPKRYSTLSKLVAIWNCICIAIGVYAVCLTNSYRRQYAFECDTFLVDHQSQTYHLNWDCDCQAAGDAINLVEMKGYQIDESYNFCEECECWAMDAVDNYNADRYSRR